MQEDKFPENIEKIRREIALYNPVLIAVTKYFDEAGIVEYYKTGLRHFGENRVKDALEKIAKLPSEIRENSHFHLIGHLQTNKVKQAVGNFEYIHSVDSLKLAKAISEEAQKRGIVQKVLIQINNANEPQKFGFSKDELYSDYPEIIKLPSIEVCGVMNIAPLNRSEEELHRLFKEIKQINDDLKLKYNVKSEQISMGMSKDFRIALEEGATMIRLGRVLFE